MTIKEIVVDVREFEPPKPLQEGINALRNLKEDEVLVFIHRMRPCRFIPILDKNGYRYEIVKDEENYFEMKVWSN